MTEDCQRSNTEGLSCRAARHVFDPQGRGQRGSTRVHKGGAEISIGVMNHPLVVTFA